MKNKLVLTISIFLISISTSVFSQKSPYVVGVESGMGISSIRPSLSDNSVRVVLIEGITGQYIFSDLLSIKTGLGYELKGAKGVIPLEENPMGEGKYYMNFHFLTIPVLAKFNFSKKLNFFKNDIKYFANGGTYLGFLLKENTKIKATEYSAEVKTNNTDDFKRVEFGLTLGGGIAYSLYKDMDLTLELRDNFGLNNLYKGDNASGSSVKTNAAYILVGVAMRL